MTGQTEDLIWREDSTDAGAQEMAAARLINDAARSLSRALAASGLSGKELSQKLGVTQGRISKVINGEGNMRLSTFARVLRAMGYRARLVIEPAVPGALPLPEPQRSKVRERAQKSYITVFKVPVMSPDGASEGILLWHGPVEHVDVLLGYPQHSVTRTRVQGVVQLADAPSGKPLAVTP